MKIERILIVLLCAILLLQVGCTCPSGDGTARSAPAARAPMAMETPLAMEAAPTPEPRMEAYNPCAAPQMAATERMVSSRGYSGDAVRVTRLAPSQVVLNEPFDLQAKITNVSDQEITNVTVTDVQSPNLKVTSSEPEMTQAEGQVRWVLGAIGPGESKTISLKAVATELGTVRTCAQVTYDMPMCAQIEIVEPKLRLAKTAPSQSVACDRIPLKYTIENTGTGHACDISISDTLPEGMITAEGRREVKFNLDSLGPNESRDFEVMVDAGRPGQYSSAATAVARTGGSAESNATATKVTQPILEIQASGAERQYLGRAATFTITVMNKGDAAAEDAVVETTMPSGARFGSASMGGSLSQDKIVWNIGDLQPQGSRELTFSVMMDQPGNLMTRASARAYCADAVMTAAQTQIVGVAGILLEVVDISDPIELGQTETYTITVTNQGSATDTGIRVICQLEEGMQYVSSTGPTAGRLEGDKVVFAPLASLSPKAEAVWKINVKAVGAGDKRFKVQMNSDQLGERPVQESEATTFYGPVQ